jgi:hypothetical protein
MEAQMNAAGYTHFAEALVFVHGTRALSEASRHAELARRTGDEDMAAHWQATLVELKHFTTPEPRRAA